MIPCRADELQMLEARHAALLQASREVREAARTLRLISNAAHRQLLWDTFAAHQRCSAAIGRLALLTGRDLPAAPAPLPRAGNQVPISSEPRRAIGISKETQMPRAPVLVGAIVAAILCLAAPSARAASLQPFTQPAFAAAQQAGKPILVEIDASWCPTCAQQRPILGKLMQEPAFAALCIYEVDFDSQKDVVRALGARMQSTLIVFHGAVEKGRSTGETDPGAIRTLLAEAVQ